MIEYPIKAKKSLGQNFLIDEEALSDIANSIEVAGKHIIEVGPGYGALTDYLIAKNPESLDLVELDGDMVEILSKKFAPEVSIPLGGGTKGGLVSERNIKLSPPTPPHRGDQKVTIHEQDILKFTPPYEQYSVIANIPYYITSPILFHFLYDLSSAPGEMVIMMQKEVGEKILAGRARKSHHSLLSLAMEQACEDIQAVRYVGSESFRPAPKVDSIVLKFTVKKDRNHDEEDALIKLWKVAFAHPRKTLLSNLKGSHYDIEAIKNTLVELGYDSLVRAEAVKREDWKNILDI